MRPAAPPVPPLPSPAAWCSEPSVSLVGSVRLAARLPSDHVPVSSQVWPERSPSILTTVSREVSALCPAATRGWWALPSPAGPVPAPAVPVRGSRGSGLGSPSFHPHRSIQSRTLAGEHPLPWVRQGAGALSRIPAAEGACLGPPSGASSLCRWGLQPSGSKSHPLAVPTCGLTLRSWRVRILCPLQATPTGPGMGTAGLHLLARASAAPPGPRPRPRAHALCPRADAPGRGFSHQNHRNRTFSPETFRQCLWQHLFPKEKPARLDERERRQQRG